MRRYHHGLWPYAIPYFGFLLTAQFGGANPYVLPLKVAVPLIALTYFWRRGCYPELGGATTLSRQTLLDAAVGLAGAALWVVPYLLWDSLRPSSESGFDPRKFHASLLWPALALRFVGFAAVTPVMEELFVRSGLVRYIESVWGSKADFRDVAIAQFTARSFLAVVLWFTFSHASWEWPVAVLWILLTQLWFYHRKQIAAVVVAHAVSNCSIFLFVVIADGRLIDAQGRTISPWFFL